MTKEDIVDIKRFRTWLKISMKIGGDVSRESWQTLSFINAFLSSEKHPETFYIRDILDFLKNHENEELLDYMKIQCCNGWPITEKDMGNAEHMLVHRLLFPFGNYGRRYNISCLRTSPLCFYRKNTKFGIGLDLHAFYKDSFIGTEYHSMSILKKFVNSEEINFSEPLEYSLSPKEISNEYLDFVLFEHMVWKVFHKYNNFIASNDNCEVKQVLIDEESAKVINKYKSLLMRRKKYTKKLQEQIREYIYSRWNFRFKIEDDGDIFLFDYNYIADEPFYKNIFHKLIDKKSYRMKNYTKEFNFKMSLLEFELFIKNHKEYVNYDAETIKLLIY